MLQVTLEVFSGRPNPTLAVDEEEAQAVLRDLALDRDAVAEQKPEAAVLGYRGARLDLQSDYLAQEYNLPRTFWINTGRTRAESKGQEIAERLVSGMLDHTYISGVRPDTG